MRKKQKRERTRWTVLGAFALASVALVSCAFWFQGRILPGVRAYTIPVGGLTVTEAEHRIADHLAASAVTLTDGQRNWRATLAELGVSIDARAVALRAFSVGRTSGAADTVATIVLRHPVPVAASWSRTALRDRLAAVARSIGSPPLNAGLAYRDGAFVVTPDADGLVIDAANVRSDVSRILATPSTAPVRLAVRTAHAGIRAADLAPLRDEADRLVARPVAVTARERAYPLDPFTLAGWLTVHGSPDDAGNELASLAPAAVRGQDVALGVNDQAIEAYLASVAADVYVAPKPQRMLRSAHNTVTLEQGMPGIMLAAEQAAGLLREKLIDAGTTAIDLPTVDVPFQTEFVDPPPAPQPAGKVIAVDLTRQIEYDYEDGTLTYATFISSGINDWTPMGTFRVYAKTEKQKMSGPGYYVPNVPHILWFKGDYSLHGVYWHNDFGIRPRSHGCVGEPLDAAEWIFNWAEVGTPVVIYKS